MSSTQTIPPALQEITDAYEGPEPIAYGWGRGVVIEGEIIWVEWDHVNNKGEHPGSFAQLCDVVGEITPMHPFVTPSLVQFDRLSAQTGKVGLSRVFRPKRNDNELVPVAAALFHENRPPKYQVVQHWLYEYLDFNRRQAIIDRSGVEESIAKLWEDWDSVAFDERAATLREARNLIESGVALSAEFRGFEPHYRDWVRQAVLMLFRGDNVLLKGPHGQPAYDKVKMLFDPDPRNWPTDEEFAAAEVRWVPGSSARTLTFVDKKAIVMALAFLNSGCSGGVGVMFDVGSRGGSAARIGHYVHLSGGAGVGGVLEPLQAHPTILGDFCFVGANAEVAEGFVMEPFSVLAACQAALAGIKIYDAVFDVRREPGRLPAGAIAVGGSAPLGDKYPGHGKPGTPFMDCLIIIAYRSPGTHPNVAINDALR